MTIVSKTKAAVKKALKPKRPVYVQPPPPAPPPPPPPKARAKKPEAEKLEPSVYTPPPPKAPPPKKERPPIPDRFLNGGGTAEERLKWFKENGYG